MARACAEFGLNVAGGAPLPVQRQQSGGSDVL